MEVLGIHPGQIEVFILVFARIASIIMLVPVFGSEDVPLAAKAGLSLLLAVLVFPNVSTSYAGPMSFALPQFTVAFLKEIFIGICIGYTATFLFVSVQFAGLLIDRQMGFEMVRAVDPTTQEEVTFSGQFQMIVFTIIFLVINAHYFLILAIQKSFELIPLLGAKLPAETISFFMSGLVGNVFEISIRLAAPVFIVLFITTLGLGVVARTVPQINVFFVGLPIQITVGIVTFIIALPILATIFRAMTQQMIEDVWKILYILA
jgi:flagellar biosynthesis protein FliR